jgi:hypothetical protein
VSEKRKFQRLPVPSIACRLYQECRLIDLSIGGAFVESASPFGRGTEASIEFALPTAPARAIRAGVKVEWTGDYFGGRGTPCLGMGLSFRSVSPEDRLAIATFLRKAYDLTRGALRVRTRIPAKVTAGGHLASGLVREIGERGVYVETANLAPLGAEVEVEIDLPNATAPVRAHTIVVRVEAVPADGAAPEEHRHEMRGLRLEFVDLGIAARELIKSYLDDEKKKGANEE